MSVSLSTSSLAQPQRELARRDLAPRVIAILASAAILLIAAPAPGDSVYSTTVGYQQLSAREGRSYLGMVFEPPAVSPSALISDGFNDGTIDSAKWDPHSSGGAVAPAESGGLLTTTISATGSDQRSLVYSDSTNFNFYSDPITINLSIVSKSGQGSAGTTVHRFGMIYYDAGDVYRYVAGPVDAGVYIAAVNHEGTEKVEFGRIKVGEGIGQAVQRTYSGTLTDLALTLDGQNYTVTASGSSFSMSGGNTFTGTIDLVESDFNNSFTFSVGVSHRGSVTAAGSAEWNKASLTTPADSATLLSVLDNDQAPAAATEGAASTVHVWNQDEQTLTNSYWLSSSGGSNAWRFGGATAVANGVAVDRDKGLIVTIPVGQGSQSIVLKGSVSTQDMEQVVVSNGYTLAAAPFPVPVSFADSGLLESGFVGGSNLVSSDNLLFYSAQTNYFETKIWYDSTASVWRNTDTTLADRQLQPGESFLIRRRSRTSSMTWTSACPFSLP